MSEWSEGIGLPAVIPVMDEWLGRARAVLQFPVGLTSPSLQLKLIQLLIIRLRSSC